MKKKILDKIKEVLGIKKTLKYPIPFAIIKYTETALQNNMRDDQNKIISLYYRNKYGNISTKRYKYTGSFVKLLEKRGIPTYDKTKTETRFPVFIKELPGEIVYTKK